jgi:hypothetical protein
VKEKKIHGKIGKEARICMGQGLDGIIEEIDRYKLQKKKETWKVWYRLGLANTF